MSSLMRRPGFDEVLEVPDNEHYAYLSLGYIYLGPVPQQFDEISMDSKPLKKKKKSEKPHVD